MSKTLFSAFIIVPTATGSPRVARGGPKPQNLADSWPTGPKLGIDSGEKFLLGSYHTNFFSSIDLRARGSIFRGPRGETNLWVLASKGDEKLLFSSKIRFYTTSVGFGVKG